MLTAVLTVLLFCIMIIPHEFGHFAAAKLLGVQVNEFSIGMGPKLWQKQKGETKYTIRLLPIGGYNSMEGEDEESDNPRAFNNKPAWRKLIILFAGGFMNIVTGLLIMIIALEIMGMPTTTIGKVNAGSPAAEAGLQSGDKIVSINGTDTPTWTKVAENIQNSKSETLQIGVERNGSPRTYAVTTEQKDGRQIIGINSKLGHNPFAAIKYGSITTWELNKSMYKGLYMLITGKVSFKNNVSGPVGIVNLVGQSSRQGVLSYLYLTVLICINLAVINLLPLPALDGGRIVFVIIRKITGNAITDRQEGMVHLAGFMLLMLLAVAVTVNDVTKLLH